MEDGEGSPKGSPEGKGLSAKRGGEGDAKEKQVWMVGKEGKEGGKKEAGAGGCSGVTAAKEEDKADV